VSDEELAALYTRAQALIQPNVEEFGIAAVEAQAAGRPVVGVDAGGAQET
jgi:glycosyltransferase involved in cell wall biosynthesis